MVSILKISEEDFESAVDVAHALLHSDGVLVYPTDTVYGIGGNAISQEVVMRVHHIKEIKTQRPMSVMMADFDMIEYYCETGLWEDTILKKYLPGPYTFILKVRRKIAATNSERVGVRIPNSAFCQRLCQEFERPIVSTSANITTNPPPTQFEKIDKRILNSVDLAIDGGQTKQGSPSVVIDLVERKLLREGAKSGADIIELPPP